MKHGYDRQHHRERRQVEDVGSNDRHRVQQGGAVFVQHALGMPRRAAGVAKAAGLPFVTLVPAVIPVHPASTSSNSSSKQMKCWTEVQSRLSRSTTGANARS